MDLEPAADETNNTAPEKKHKLNPIEAEFISAAQKGLEHSAKGKQRAADVCAAKSKRQVQSDEGARKGGGTGCTANGTGTQILSVVMHSASEH